MTLPSHADVVIVGAGAAGLTTAIAVRRHQPRLRVALLDGAARPGAKILVSGGGRCNVANKIISERDFWGGRGAIVRRILRAFTVDDTIAFFRGLGITLREEAGGKLFPESNRARDVLSALLDGVSRAGASLVAPARVQRIARDGGQFAIETSRGSIAARAVVLATGGLSLPKSGSDGAGYGFAREFGHTIVPTTPALAPLLLDAAAPRAIHTRVQGVSLDVEMRVWIDGRLATHIDGALLWTHFGVSGPAVLNASRHWARAVLERTDVRITVNLHPGDTFESVDARWREAMVAHPRSTLRTRLSAAFPDSLASAVLEALDLDGDLVVAHLSRDDRRQLARTLVDWPLAVTDTRGYNFAEVTAGGVDLAQVDPATMESRRCPDLFLVGEVLDVDGRIGGFNFQWAWATGHVAGRAVAARIRARE